MLAPPAPPLAPPGLPARPPSAPDDDDPPIALVVGVTLASVMVVGFLGWLVWPRTAATPAHSRVSQIEAAYSRQLDLPIRFST